MINRMLKYKNIFLWFAIFISLVTYSSWKPIKDYYGFQVYYIGISFFIFLLSIYIWNTSKKHSIPEFVLFSLSLNNLLDELFYNPLEFETNEMVFVLIIVVYIIKLKKRGLNE